MKPRCRQLPAGRNPEERIGSCLGLDAQRALERPVLFRQLEGQTVEFERRPDRDDGALFIQIENPVRSFGAVAGKPILDLVPVKGRKARAGGARSIRREGQHGCDGQPVLNRCFELCRQAEITGEHESGAGCGLLALAGFGEFGKKILYVSQTFLLKKQRPRRGERSGRVDGGGQEQIIQSREYKEPREGLMVILLSLFGRLFDEGAELWSRTLIPRP